MTNTAGRPVFRRNLVAACARASRVLSSWDLASLLLSAHFFPTFQAFAQDWKPWKDSTSSRLLNRQSAAHGDQR